MFVLDLEPGDEVLQSWSRTDTLSHGDFHGHDLDVS